jgi:hypothetical protein
MAEAKVFVATIHVEEEVTVFAENKTAAEEKCRAGMYWRTEGQQRKFVKVVAIDEGRLEK